MKKQLILAIAASVFGGYAANAVAQPPKPQPPQTPNLQAQADANLNVLDAVEASSEVDFLTRGPLHEAFASPFQSEAVAMATITRQPPQEINELPPAYQPDGENVVWIPGYWAWDEEADDFLWISGVWRDVPPGERWIPGYWQEVDANQYRWVRGFWIDAEAQQLSYLPEPPESQENGPSTAAPDDSHFYIPGHWSYVDNDYRWAPGYWVPAEQDWVWIPAQYVWTPRGYVFVDGYWDYSLNDRGLVFAPVQFRKAVYVEPNFAYRPRYVVDAGASLLVNLFYHPQTRQYYFGDYYGSQYGQAFNPWVSYYGNSRRYDPLYTYYNRQTVGEVNAIDWLAKQNNYFARNKDYRPARTVAAQRNFLKSSLVASDVDRNDPDGDMLRAATLVDELESFTKRNDRNLRFRTVSFEEANSLRQQMVNYDTKMIQQRREFEVAQSLDKNSMQGNAGMKIPTFVDRTDSRNRQQDNGKWLSPEQIARGKRAAAKLKTNQEISDAALQRISEQGIAARQYWEQMREEGRVRPDGTDNWPALGRNNANFTPPNRPQGRKTATDSIPSAPSTASNIGSGSNSGAGGAGRTSGKGLPTPGLRPKKLRPNNRGKGRGGNK